MLILDTRARMQANEPDGLTRIMAYVGRVPLPNSWSDAATLIKSLNVRAFPSETDATWISVARQWFSDDLGNRHSLRLRRRSGAFACVHGQRRGCQIENRLGNQCFVGRLAQPMIEGIEDRLALPTAHLAGLAPQLLGGDPEDRATLRATGSHQGLIPLRHTQSSRVSATCSGIHWA